MKCNTYIVLGGNIVIERRPEPEPFPDDIMEPDVFVQNIHQEESPLEMLARSLREKGIGYRYSATAEVPSIPTPIPSIDQFGPGDFDPTSVSAHVIIPREILKCWDIRDINSFSRAKLHFFFYWNNKYYTNCVCEFNLLWKSNLLFGSVTSSLAGRDHSAEIDQIDRGTTAIFRLIYTGALGGFSMERIRYFFSSFQLTFVGSRGGGAGEAIPPSNVLGVRFFSWKTEWFNIDDYFGEEYCFFLNLSGRPDFSEDLDLLSMFFFFFCIFLF